jgi:acyl-coenzyme A synthetase/AMP-(fatty) acid ligase
MAFRIIDDSGRDVAAGTPGEFLVRATGDDPRRGFFSGYLKDEAATEEAWADGWFHTGDVVTADATGLLYFFDRKKSIVRRSGENIGVLEVETALAADPAIKAAAVTAAPDEIRGEEVFAFVIPAPEAAAEQRQALAERIVRACARAIAYHKAPGYIALVDQLPLSSTQKLQRGEIKAMAARLVAAGEAIDLRELKGRLRTAQK